jgi:hypothetical protein
MAVSDSQFRLGVLVGGAFLVGVITYVRFCGSVALPAKSAPPVAVSGTERQLLARSTGTPAVYQSYLEHDAAQAGKVAPTIEDMSKKFPDRVDEARHVLEPGQPPIEIAGLRVHVERNANDIVLVAQNMVASDVAYSITTMPSINLSACSAARPLPFNAMVIAKGASETRTECVWRDGMSIIVTRVETMEVPPLSAWYLSQVPPRLVGIDDRVARGHHGVGSPSQCSTVVPAVVKGLMERGDLTWRDLADFYARHRCQSYAFPSAYRAFKSDGERALPAVD